MYVQKYDQDVRIVFDHSVEAPGVSWEVECHLDHTVCTLSRRREHVTLTQDRKEHS